MEYALWHKELILMRRRSFHVPQGHFMFEKIHVLFPFPFSFTKKLARRHCTLPVGWRLLFITEASLSGSAYIASFIFSVGIVAEVALHEYYRRTLVAGAACQVAKRAYKVGQPPRRGAH